MRGGIDLLATRWGRRGLFALLYLAEGAPIGYVWWALPTRLRDAGVPIDDVTRLTALVTLPWAFKFLWAPLVDAFRPARGGLRVWITGAQLAMGFTLLPVVGLDPARQMDWLLVVLLLHAFSAATQDVAIDALAVAATPPDERGAMTGWMQIGMLTGRATFGGLALAAEQWVGPGAVVGALVGFVWLSSGAVWLARERAPDTPASAPTPVQRLGHFARRLGQVASLPATWLGLAIAVVGGAAMEATGTVAGPLLIDLGYDTAAVGRFFALPAVAAMGLGALAGGRLSDRGRRDAGLGRAVLALGAGVLGLAAIAGAEPPAPPALLFAALGTVYALFGVYTAHAYALFMELTEPRLGGTQFSAYMSGINLCSVWSAWAVGGLAAGAGYPTALAALVAASLAVLPLLWVLRRSRRRRPALRRRR